MFEIFVDFTYFLGKFRKPFSRFLLNYQNQIKYVICSLKQVKNTQII